MSKKNPYVEVAIQTVTAYDEAASNAEGEAIWKVANPNDTTNPGSWYDYSNEEKQWANAVTVKADKLADYQNPNTTIDNNDVLGYWVYIPRYAYEVQRPNAVDRVVADEYPLPDNEYFDYPIDRNSHAIKNSFTIHFETADDTKKTPASSCNLGIETAEQMWDNGTPTSNAGPDNTNIKAKDYRTGCAAPGNTNGPNNSTISRLYTDATTLAGSTTANNTTWTTHPAFSWLDSEGNGTELNGIWVGKFETTGTRTNPTVKPNQHANIAEYIGTFYTMAKHIGIYDENNTGGNDVTGNNTTLYANNGRWTSLHNLKTTTSHMLKNSEWGAVAYLASSIYGAGTNNVSINSAYPTTSADADGTSSRYGITGCGPKDIDRSAGSYSSVTTSTGEVTLPALSSSHIEDPLACGDTAHSYIGNIGVLASTTTTKPPYVDLLETADGFDIQPKWSVSSTGEYYNNDVCTWDSCGGQATHETNLFQSANWYTDSWGDDDSSMNNLESPWLKRGDFTGRSSVSGIFASLEADGFINNSSGLRVALITP